MGKRVTIALFVLVLAACQSEPMPPPPDVPLTRADLTAAIEWERLPLSVVFRAEIARTDTESFASRNEIADCTVYGDNRVVYTTEAEDGRQVIWQQVDDDAVRLFIDDILHERGIAEQTSRFEGDEALADERFFESLLLVTNGMVYHTDSTGEWREGYYHALTERCRALAESPAVLLPASGYVSVQPVAYDLTRPMVDWNPEQGLDLSAFGPERTWVTGAGLQALWSLQRSMGANIQVQQGEDFYIVAVEVPGVSRFSPPPPER